MRLEGGLRLFSSSASSSNAAAVPWRSFPAPHRSPGPGPPGRKARARPGHQGSAGRAGVPGSQHGPMADARWGRVGRHRGLLLLFLPLLLLSPAAAKSLQPPPLQRARGGAGQGGCQALAAWPRLCWGGCPCRPFLCPLALGWRPERSSPACPASRSPNGHVREGSAHAHSQPGPAALAPRAGAAAGPGLSWGQEAACAGWWLTLTRNWAGVGGHIWAREQALGSVRLAQGQAGCQP